MTAIYTVPKGRSHWVVRAQDGYYYEHFTKYGLIALGHLDVVGLPETKSGSMDYDEQEVYQRLLKYHSRDGKKSGTATSHSRQSTAFINDMKVGDWVLTVGERKLRFGRVVGSPYISRDALEIWDDSKGKNRRTMNFNLRRRVNWGPTIARSKMPFGLRRSLSANQTVFNIDSHWYAIYHTLYPAFCSDGVLHLSAYINSTEDLKNYALTSIFKYLNEIEVIGKEFDSGIDTENFENKFKEYVRNNEITTTTKAQFESPGEIWNAVSQIAPNFPMTFYYIVAGYAMIFGNRKLGFDGIVDVETRQRIWKILLDRFEKNNVEEAADSLKMSTPRVDTQKLEDSSDDES